MQPHRRITVAVGFAMLLDAALYMAIVPLLPDLAVRFHLGTFGTAVLLASFPVSTPVVSVACIPLATRVGGRTIMRAAAVVMVGATIAFALAPTAWVLILARFVQGIASGTVWTAGMAWVTENAPEERRGAEAGIVMGLFSAGSIAGPGIGALAAWIGHAPAFLLVAGAGIAGVVATLVAPAGVAVPPGPPLRSALVAVARSPRARAAFAMTMVDPIAFVTIDLLVPLDLGDRGVSTSVLAAAIAVGSALGAAAGPLAGRLVDRVGASGVGLWSALLIALSPVPLVASPPTWVQLAVLVAIGPIFSASAAAMYPLASEGAEAVGAPHAAANGLLGAVWASVSTSTALVAGAVAGVSGSALAFALAIALCAPLVAIVWHQGLRVPATPSA